MNKVELIGRLTGTIEIRHSQSANPVAMMQNGLAVRKKYITQNENDTEFFKVKAFGKIAELIEKHLTKGSQVGIVGRLEVERWEKDNIKHSQVVIVIEELTFIGNKQEVQMLQTIEEEDDLPF